MDRQPGGVGALDLHSLLNIDRADQVFQELLRRVAAQSAELRQLREEVARRAPVETVHQLCSALQEHLKRLDVRMRAVEVAIVVPGSEDSPLPNVGDQVKANQAALARAMELLSHKAESVDMAHAAERAEARLMEEVDQIRSISATKEFTDGLEKAQLHLQGQMDAASQQLVHKADKSELAQIEATCSKLRSFSAHVDNSAAALDRLRERADHAEDALGGLTTRVDAMEDHGQQLASAVATKAASADLDSARTLLANLGDAHQSAVAQQQSAAAAADGLVRRCQEQLDKLQAELDTLTQSSDARFTKVAADLSVIPTASNLAKKAEATDVEQIRAELQRQIEGKAGVRSVRTLSDEVGVLAQQSADHTQQLRLSLRFIDWFSERGESYEHNMKALDAHLGRFATLPTPAQLDPYAGQVRFTPHQPRPSAASREGSAGSGLGIATAPPPPGTVPARSAAAAPR